MDSQGDQPKLRPYNESDPVIVLLLLKQAVEQLTKVVNDNHIAVIGLIGDAQQKIGRQEAQIEQININALKQQNQIDKIAWKASTIGGGVGAVISILGQLLVKSIK